MTYAQEVHNEIHSFLYDFYRPVALIAAADQLSDDKYLTVLVAMVNEQLTTLMGRLQTLEATALANAHMPVVDTSEALAAPPTVANKVARKSRKAVSR